MIAVAPFIPMVAQLAQSQSAPTTSAPQQAPADTYVPSQARADAPVNYRQMLAASRGNEPGAARELPVEAMLVRAGVRNQDFKGVETAMAGMNRHDRLRTLEDLRQSYPKEYAGLMAGIRDGSITSEEVTMPAGIDRLKSTKWAQSGDGLDVANHVQLQYLEKRIVTTDVPDKAMGITRPDVKGAGQNGQETQAKIHVTPKIAQSPEALATLLAHEGSHSWNYNRGAVKADLYEETDAHMAQSEVWKSFDNTKYTPGTKELTKDFDEDLGFADSRNHMLGHVAATYTRAYREQGDDQRAAEMSMQFVNAAQRRPSLIRTMDDNDLNSFYVNVSQLARMSSNRTEIEPMLAGFGQEVARRNE